MKKIFGILFFSGLLSALPSLKRQPMYNSLEETAGGMARQITSKLLLHDSFEEPLQQLALAYLRRELSVEDYHLDVIGTLPENKKKLYVKEITF